MQKYNGGLTVVYNGCKTAVINNKTNSKTISFMKDI